MANLRLFSGETRPRCQPGTHPRCGADGIQFIKYRFKLLGILRADKPAHMPNHRIHIQRKQYLLAYRILMPKAGNIQFVTVEKHFHDTNQLHRKKLLVATEAIRTL